MPTKTRSRPVKAQKGHTVLPVRPSATSINYDSDNDTAFLLRRQMLASRNVPEPVLSILQHLAWEVVDARY